MIVKIEIFIETHVVLLCVCEVGQEHVFAIVPFRFDSGGHSALLQA